MDLGKGRVDDAPREKQRNYLIHKSRHVLFWALKNPPVPLIPKGPIDHKGQPLPHLFTMGRQAHPAVLAPFLHKTSHGAMLHPNPSKLLHASNLHTKRETIMEKYVATRLLILATHAASLVFNVNVDPGIFQNLHKGCHLTYLPIIKVSS